MLSQAGETLNALEVKSRSTGAVLLLKSVSSIQTGKECEEEPELKPWI
jgi:hypothetical protein